MQRHLIKTISKKLENTYLNFRSYYMGQIISFMKKKRLNLKRGQYKRKKEESFFDNFLPDTRDTSFRILKSSCLS